MGERIGYCKSSQCLSWKWVPDKRLSFPRHISCVCSLVLLLSAVDSRPSDEDSLTLDSKPQVFCNYSSTKQTGTENDIENQSVFIQMPERERQPGD